MLLIVVFRDETTEAVPNVFWEDWLKGTDSTVDFIEDDSLSGIEFVPLLFIGLLTVAAFVTKLSTNVLVASVVSSILIWSFEVVSIWSFSWRLSSVWEAINFCFFKAWWSIWVSSSTISGAWVRPSSSIHLEIMKQNVNLRSKISVYLMGHQLKVLFIGNHVVLNFKLTYINELSG